MKHGQPPRGGRTSPEGARRTSCGSPVGQDQPRGGGQRGRQGYGEDPGPDDTSRHSPANGREALGGAHTHDGARDGVSGADRDTTDGGADEHHSPGGLGAEASDGT